MPDRYLVGSCIRICRELSYVSEAALQRCCKEVFWKYVPNLKEKTHAECGIGFIKTSLEGYFLVFYDNTHESLGDITKYVHDRLNLTALRKLDHIGLTRRKWVSEFRNAFESFFK